VKARPTSRLDQASSTGLAERSSCNSVLWIAFAATALGVGTFSVLHLYRGLSLDSALAFGSLLARTGLYVSLGLLVEALLLRSADGFLAATRARRVVLHAHWIAVMFLCVALIVDVFVFGFAGYHVPTALRILFADGPAGVGEVVEATGLPPKLVASSVGGALAGLAVAIGLSKLSRRLSNRAGLLVSRRSAVTGVFVALGALAAVEVVGSRTRNPFLWEREVRSVPLAFSLMRPPAELATVRVAVARPPLADQRARAAEVRPLDEKPDVFIVVIESLRKDVVTPETMPRLSDFARGSWTFEHALTTGNVTHYSWYGLFCGQFPLFFDLIKPMPGEHGSIPLTVLRKLGYRIVLFATPDTEYQNLESVVFGPGGALFDEKHHPSLATPADRDRVVIDELDRRLASTPRGGHVYLVALDSSHFDYQWGADFRPPFVPFAKDASIARSYRVGTPAHRELVNRYRDAAAWVDSLLGQFFDTLKATGRQDRSIVVLTGDHGEAFWEHGVGTHGSDLAAEQLEVGFALRLPGEAPRHFDSVFSLMDVTPTILAQLGVDTSGLLSGVPVQRRRTTPDGPLAPRSALTFQGWNSREFRFALTSERHRVLLALDNENPTRAQALIVRDVVDLGDHSLVDVEDHAVAGAYRGVVRDLPTILDSLPFLEAF
jgi:uncharacterized protein